MSKRYSGKSFKDSSVMKKPKLTFKEKRKLKEEKKRKDAKVFRDLGSGFWVLGLGFMVFVQNQAGADYMSDEKCAELAGKAYTDYVARQI